MRIVLLGATDPIASEYLSVLADWPDALEVVGLVEPQASVGRSLASSFGVPWYTSVEDLPPDNLDAAILGARMEERPGWLARMPSAVRHVLCQMPAGSTSVAAEAAVGRCAAQGISVHQAWPWRFLSVTQTLRTMIADGTLGEPLSFNLQHRARRLAPSTEADTIRQTMLQDVFQAIDLVCWLDSAGIVDLHAEVGRGMWHAAAAPDAVILSAALANGAYATLDVSLVLMPGFPVAEDLQLEVIGTGGWVRIAPSGQHIAVHTGEGVRWTEWGSRPTRGLVEAFLDAVRHDRPADLVDYGPEVWFLLSYDGER